MIFCCQDIVTFMKLNNVKVQWYKNLRVNNKRNNSDLSIWCISIEHDVVIYKGNVKQYREMERKQVFAQFFCCKAE